MLLCEIFNDEGQADLFPLDTLPMDDRNRHGRAKALGFDTGRVWYHGSSRLVSVLQHGFDPRFLGRNTRHPGAGLGFYFTTDPKEAAHYGLRRELNRDEIEMGKLDSLRGQVYEGFFLKMTHTLWLDENIDEFLEIFGGIWKDPDRMAREAQEWLANVKEQGYDSILAPADSRKRNRLRDHWHAIVFNPAQVRAADAAFDPTHRDAATPRA